MADVARVSTVVRNVSVSLGTSLVNIMLVCGVSPTVSDIASIRSPLCAQPVCIWCRDRGSYAILRGVKGFTGIAQVLADHRGCAGGAAVCLDKEGGVKQLLGSHSETFNGHLNNFSIMISKCSPFTRIA